MNPKLAKEAKQAPLRPQWHLSGAGKGIAPNDSEGRWGPSTACPRISSSRSARPLRKSRTQVAKCLLPATQQVIFTYPRAVWRHNPGNRSRPANLRMLLHCVRRRSALWRGKEGILLTRLAPRGRCNRWCLWGGTDSFSNFSHICHALYSFFAFFFTTIAELFNFTRESHILGQIINFISFEIFVNLCHVVFFPGPQLVYFPFHCNNNKYQTYLFNFSDHIHNHYFPLHFLPF